MDFKFNSLFSQCDANDSETIFNSLSINNIQANFLKTIFFLVDNSLKLIINRFIINLPNYDIIRY